MRYALLTVGYGDVDSNYSSGKGWNYLIIFTDNEITGNYVFFIELKQVDQNKLKWYFMHKHICYKRGSKNVIL